MKYFYTVCVLLVLALLGNLIFLDYNRVQGVAVQKTITDVPVLGFNLGCEQEWMGGRLQSSIQDQYTQGGIACFYSGHILKKQCDPEKELRIGIYSDGHQECSLQTNKKLQHIVILKEDPEPPKPRDCKALWMGNALVPEPAGVHTCRYLGTVEEQQCRADGNGTTMVLRYDSSRQCHQQTLNGYLQIMDITNPYMNIAADPKSAKNSITCEPMWLNRPLQKESSANEHPKTCFYSGQIERISCDALIPKEHAFFEDKAHDIIYCVVPPTGPDGVVKRVEVYNPVWRGNTQAPPKNLLSRDVK